MMKGLLFYSTGLAETMYPEAQPPFGRIVLTSQDRQHVLPGDGILLKGSRAAGTGLFIRIDFIDKRFP